MPMAKGRNKIIRRRIQSAYLSSVISTSLVLLLVGLASLLLVNTRAVTDYFKEHMQVSVMLKPEVEEDEAYSLKNEMDSLYFIKATELVSREQGESEMRAMLGDDFLSVFETSPIPVSINLSLKASHVSKDSLKVVEGAVSRFPQVDEVVYQQNLVESLSQNLGKISGVLAVMIAVLLFISFVLINNMMRLQVYDKRFTIHTMRLVGATKSFIRKPFLAKSAVMALFASALAIVFLLGLLYYLKTQLPQIMDVFRLDLLLLVMGIIVVSGLVICVVSTYLVAGRLVSLSNDELYS